MARAGRWAAGRRAPVPVSVARTTPALRWHLDDGEWIVLAFDWPHAARGAADPETVTTYAVSLAGFFVHESLLPDPPGIPHVRAFQRAQGEVCLDWLRVRLGG